MQLGQITASIGADISGKSEGFMSDVSWMKRFDVAGFGVYTVLAILIGRRMGLATTTPGIKKLEGVDPWEK